MNLWYYELLKYLKQVIIICAQYFSVCRKRSKVSQTEIRKLIYTLVEMNITRWNAEAGDATAHPLPFIYTPAAKVNDWDESTRHWPLVFRVILPSHALTHSRTCVRAAGVYRRGARSASLRRPNRSCSKNFSALPCRFTSVARYSRDEPEVIR